jgi:hypothetical protein
VIGKVREGLLRGMVEDTLVDKAGTIGLEPKVVREALTMHVDELLHTRGVLRLVKAQINGMMPGVYFGCCCRCWSSRCWWRWRSGPRSGSGGRGRWRAAVVPAAGRQQVPAEGS